MAAKLIGHQMAVVGAPGDVHTSALNVVGSRSFDDAGNEYIYLKGVANTVLGSVALYDKNFATSLSVTGARGPVAFATGATVANTWGWYQIVGSATGNFAGAAVANAKLYSAGTGTCDDAVVVGDQISGAYVGATVLGAGTGSVLLSYPQMNGIG